MGAMVSRQLLVTAMSVSRIALLAGVAVVLGGWTSLNDAAPMCVIMAREFCVGSAAKQYRVSMVEQNHAGKLVEGFTYAVTGDGEKRRTHFVALVRNVDAPALNDSSDRERLCQILRVDSRDCSGAPQKTVTRTYQVLYEGHPYPVVKGIRIDLLTANGVSRDIINSLAFPCAVLENGSRTCGPSLGTCIRRRNSNGCDFQDNFWNSVWKWRWRNW